MALPVWLASARTALRRMRIFRSGTVRAQGAAVSPRGGSCCLLLKTCYTSTVSVLLCMRMLLVRNCTCIVQNASARQDGRFSSLLSAQVSAQVSSQEYPVYAAC